MSCSTQLRNTAIYRLIIVLLSFGGYGGISLYFNAFFHDYNKTTTAQFFTLQKRSVLIPSISSFLREAVKTGHMIYLLRNTGTADLDC